MSENSENVTPTEKCAWLPAAWMELLKQRGSDGVLRGDVVAVGEGAVTVRWRHPDDPTTIWDTVLSDNVDFFFTPSKMLRLGETITMTGRVGSDVVDITWPRPLSDGLGVGR